MCFLIHTVVKRSGVFNGGAGMAAYVNLMLRENSSFFYLRKLGTKIVES